MYYTNKKREVEKVNVNGFIIQRLEERGYKGVDGDNWYLNYEGDNNYYSEYYDSHVDKSWESQEHVDCCTDKEYIHLYVQESQKLGIKFRLLLCETEKELPRMPDVESLKTKLLGYDYAYFGGSYYSCILNDIISGRISAFNSIVLNEYGLFETLEEMKKFVEERDRLKNEFNFEGGEFGIYRISEVTVV